jgi:hydroxyethylthiazole kinase
MIISPPFLAEHSGTENDADWVDRMMPVDMQRGYPVNALRAWHGGIHLTHSDSGSKPDPLRAIADGTVASMREASLSKRDAPPFNYSGGTDSGYVLLRHETEIGSGDEGKIVYYSLYMHLKSIDSKIAPGKSVYRKDPLGTVGMVDGKNASHFQIFCDDENIKKIVGRTEPELDLSIDGRTDVVYGDMHFYLPAGTAFYEAAPPMNAVTQRGEAKYTSMEPLFVTMSFDKGNCTMITRQKDVLSGGEYCVVGDILKNVDGDEYEYNLYKYASKLYPDSPSAGYELLRFGRVINTEYETLVPSDAPLWRTVNYPGGKGVVNLALSNIKKFSDGDFPHWIGWHLVDDDTDMNSQCTSPTILCNTAKDLSRMVCHFPLEWDLTTVEKRFEWLKSPNEALNEPMSECDWKLLTDYGKALCLADNPLPAGRVWHFDPRQFIVHFRKCGWLGDEDIIRCTRKTVKNSDGTREVDLLHRKDVINRMLTSKNNSTGHRIRPDGVKDKLSYIMVTYGMSSPKRIAHFLSQIFCETGRLNEMVERGKDSYFDKYETKKDSRGRESNSLARKLGNTNVGDGVRFKGRGIIQTTGRQNYKTYGKYKGNYEFFLSGGNEEILVNEAYYCCDAGGFYWIQKQRMRESHGKILPWGSLSIHYWADSGVSYDDVKAVTKCVNGGSHGLDDIRWPCFEHALYVLGDDIIESENFKPIKE